MHAHAHTHTHTHTLTHIHKHTHTHTHRLTDLAESEVEEACRLTLENLQLDYLDLYLIHWPVALKKGTELWKLTDDCKLGYQPDIIAKCWKVLYVEVLLLSRVYIIKQNVL